MATLTIQNVPDRLIRRLKTRAAAHRRSLNLEVIHCLESVAQAVPIDTDELLARARGVRRAPVGLRLTDTMLERLKREGRR